MKAMILAAGLGTRLKPWTLSHPKALVPVGGVPMLQRVMLSLKQQGFDEMVINIHHFGEQILDFLKGNDFGVNYKVSDEREALLDTGGGLLQAGKILFSEDDAPFLVHNVDILSNADLKGLMEFHLASGNDVTLLTSNRESSRKLIFDKEGLLKGWHNLSTGEFRPKGFKASEGDREAAFSGIYIIGKKAIDALREYSRGIGKDAFPVMDFFLTQCEELKIGERFDPELRLIDIGKPASLKQADMLFK
ncbi:MAG: NTP transferase domain-containing protein [Muribaculaceae bacterium]|nr:NTP transferase domain-containing protein [Muribaculaceae bacterium]